MNSTFDGAEDFFALVPVTWLSDMASDADLLDLLGFPPAT